jgi:hypothetical protein
MVSWPDLIAPVIRTGRAPRVIRAVRMVPHGKQAEMRSVNLRGMVDIDPYEDDIFRKVIEQRKLHKSAEALYYWLKILANSIYGFFVELNPEIKNKNVSVSVFSGEKKFSDSSDTIEKPGAWFFPPVSRRCSELLTTGVGPSHPRNRCNTRCCEHRYPWFSERQSLSLPGGQVRRQIRSIRRRYREGTLILETEFETESGSVTLIDCMTPRNETPDLLRVTV